MGLEVIRSSDLFAKPCDNLQTLMGCAARTLTA